MKIRIGLVSIALSLLLLVACGESSSTRGATVQLLVTEPSAISRDGDPVDAIELEAFDEDGNLIYGPITAPLAEEMRFDDVPIEASQVQLDYLRNGGYILYRAEAAVAAGGRLDDPSELPAAKHESDFAILEQGGAFVVERTRLGASVSTDDKRLGPGSETDEASMRLKGVCYSPAPINFSNKSGPSIGDLFWDSFEAGGSMIYNWYSLWGSGDLGRGHYGRDDLGKIRGLGANTLRVYSIISRQLGSGGQIPEPGTGQHFAHEQFLDRAWNNGNDPLHVLVDIPMPAAAFQLGVVAAPGELEFWEATLEETVRDLAEHPAVLGFNIFNEQDSMVDAFPNQGRGPVSENTEYFYSQAVKYADLIKSIAPDKLVGWAFHDAPDFVKFASKFPEDGPTYMEQLSSFDYWGVNTYQTVNFDSFFSPGFEGSYANLQGASRKPVLFTEFGMPATGHEPDGALYEDAETRRATAEFVSRMYPLAFEQELLLGSYYFEFSDEWWKQAPNDATQWNPGDRSPSFPNGYWDEEGFGLFSISTQGRAPTDSPWAGSGPVLPQDKLTERTEITSALRAVYLNQ